MGMQDLKKCPECGKETIIQPTVSSDYVKVTCYNQTEKLVNKKLVNKPCGFNKFIKVENGDNHP